MGDVMDEIYVEEEMISILKGFLPERRGGGCQGKYSFIVVTPKPAVVADLPCWSANLPFFFFDVLLTVLHLGIFISVINQLDAQNFGFTISLFHASTCFEHMCSKHVEA